jgi:hypothetical protein
VLVQYTLHATANSHVEFFFNALGVRSTGIVSSRSYAPAPLLGTQTLDSSNALSVPTHKRTPIGQLYLPILTFVWISNEPPDLIGTPPIRTPNTIDVYLPKYPLFSCRIYQKHGNPFTLSSIEHHHPVRRMSHPPSTVIQHYYVFSHKRHPPIQIQASSNNKNCITPFTLSTYHCHHRHEFHKQGPIPGLH